MSVELDSQRCCIYFKESGGLALAEDSPGLEHAGDD